LKENLRNSYKENGYVVVKDLVDPQLLDQQLKNIYKMFMRFNKLPKGLEGVDQPWNSLSFHQEVIKFRQRDPKLFSVLYDSIQSSVALTRIVASKRLVQCVADLLEVDPCELSSISQESRIDTPYDTRNSLSWHQDFSYFPNNNSGLKALACWLLLDEITEKSGYLQVCLKSHLGGMAARPAEKFANKKGSDNNNDIEYFVSEQIPVNEGINLDKYEVESVKMSVGDVLFFNMFLFHRSGKNESNKIRFSCQNRFHVATSQDFIPFRLIPQRNPYLKEILPI
jgi:ectoine hydroxylase-related dioxygenase (phytanoyl-CoA dioxygenase family)